MQLYLSVNSSGSDTGSEHSARDSCDIEEGLHVTLGGSEKSQPIRRGKMSQSNLR